MRKLLEELFATYHRDVYNYLYSLCHDAVLSEDLTSEVFLQVVKSIGGFRGEADIKTWLFSIARHQWYHYLRKKKRQVRTESLLTYAQDAGEGKFTENGHGEKAAGARGQNVEFQNPDAAYPDKEAACRIYELLDREPERAGKIVLMRLEGYSFYEIGKKYGISESSARVIDFRTKAKIREILKKEGFVDERDYL